MDSWEDSLGGRKQPVAEARGRIGATHGLRIPAMMPVSWELPVASIGLWVVPVSRAIRQVLSPIPRIPAPASRRSPVSRSRALWQWPRRRAVGGWLPGRLAPGNRCARLLGFLRKQLADRFQSAFDQRLASFWADHVNEHFRAVAARLHGARRGDVARVYRGAG